MAIVRLNKILSNVGLCSRRGADDLIRRGCIGVNGRVVDCLGYKIDESDVITYNGTVVSVNSRRLTYIVLNKPLNCISTTDDPQGRNTVIKFFNKKKLGRLYPIGRLDRNTTGVLLITNDGDLTQKLSHPSNLIKKVYKITPDRNLSVEDAVKIEKGIYLEDGFIRVDCVVRHGRDAIVTIHSGRNRIIRRIFESLGYKVVRLERINYAGISSDGLKRGEWRFLNDEEVKYLKNQ